MRTLLVGLLCAGLACGVSACKSAAGASVQSPPVVLLDNYFNNEWKADSSGHLVRYHYVWCDTLNSGFSQLGGIIRNAGGFTDTLCSAPTDFSLTRARVYIIVDPDTPQETAHPAYIAPRDIEVICRWVNRGGTLLLLANDSGNVEFEHLNMLADRFGIRFNGDSRNRVQGRQYDDGAFATFPVHPLFVGVRKIFLKEISTLSVRPPAEALLTASDDVIIATARYGKGFVFAVGDPWFYNEYMDHRRLPEGFDNARAARNLFEWLLRLGQGGK